MANHSKTMYHMLTVLQIYPGMKEFIGWGQYALLVSVLKEYETLLKAQQLPKIVKLKPKHNRNNFTIIKGSKDDS